MSEIGIPMRCGHDIVHHEEVCIVCVIANESVNLLDWLHYFAHVNLFESEQALSIIQRFLADAREELDKNNMQYLKGEQK